MAVHDATTVDLPEWLHQLVMESAAQMYEAVGSGEMSVAEAEERMVELSREMAREVFAAALSERYGTHEGPRRPCACGRAQRFVSYRTRTVMTLLGSVRYRRAYYHCRECGRGHYLGDQAVGVDASSYSLPAQEAIALVCCEVPFERGRVLLGRLTGLEVSNSHAQTVTGSHGERLEREAEAQRRALFAGELAVVGEDAPQRLYVTLDGLKTPFVDDWHETKIGSVYEAEAGPDGVDRPGRTTHVCGAWEGPEQFGARLYQEAARRGVEGAQERIAIADGAPWTWKVVEEHFPGAVQILDFYHAVQRLHQVGRAVYGEGSARAGDWAEANRRRLWEGRVGDVLRSLRAVRPTTGEGREAVRLALGYFQVNRHRMHYPSYRARGYHIGSGVVEAACKTVAAARCKRSGMRWSKQGVQSVLNLRCLLLNGRWDQYWQPLKTAA